MEQILERLTNNKAKGVALGAGVTAVIQSSSATIIMVIGFLNAGIMNLIQFPVIMGANRYNSDSTDTKTRRYKLG